MAIGMNQRKKGLFGRPFEVPGTPGIGDGDPRLPQNDPAPGLGMRSAAPEPKKPGFFDAGGGSQYVFAGLQDFLQRRMGERPTGVTNLMQQQAQEQQAMAQNAAKMRERSLDMADKKWEIDYRRENPASTAMQQNYEYLRQIDPEAAESYLKRQTDPIQWITGPDGVPRPYGVGQANRPAVGSVMADPRKGGASSNASGGF